MKARCHRRTHAQYALYGARGIAVCERWKRSFEAFFADVGGKPSPSHSLDRIDNNGAYEPGNVRWVPSQREQMANARTAQLLTFLGDTLTVSGWARRLGMRQDTLWKRIFKRGWSVEDALTAPPDRHVQRRHRRH